MFAVVVPRHGKVVVHRGPRGEEGRDQLAHTFPNGLFFVDDAGLHPFEADGIGFADEAEKFPEIPAREIEQRIGRSDIAVLDHIAARVDGEVVFERGEINETDIVIAVGGFEAPRATAALDGEPDFHRPVFFDLGESGWDVGSDGHGFSFLTNVATSKFVWAVDGWHRAARFPIGDLAWGPGNVRRDPAENFSGRR